MESDSGTPLMGHEPRRITTEELDSLELEGSPSYVNQALRNTEEAIGQSSRMEGDRCRANP